ncbi:hypothetical protein FOA52_014766 [Chlamydomonas sp. UWO 241]|nr:hypothetical protein FOA52_014766 [Chlamydomonas sp. UWO 241]
MQTAVPMDCFTHLPLELMRMISTHLPYRDLPAYMATCRSSYAACAGAGEQGVRWMCERAVIHLGGEVCVARACTSANVALVRCLLELPNVKPLTKASIVAAAAAGCMDCVAELLAHGAPMLRKKDSPPLYAAAEHGHEALVQFFLEHLRATTPPNICVWATHCALSRAAAGNHIHVARLLIAAGAHPAVLTCGALWQAAKNGSVDLCTLLLAHGADVHDAADSALRIAATNGHLDAIRCLLAHGADVHGADDGALIEAAAAGRVDSCRLLLESGADPSAREGEVLAMAAEGGWQELVLMVLVAMLGKPEADEQAEAALVRVGPRTDVSMLRLLQLSRVGASKDELQQLADMPQGDGRDAAALVLLRRRAHPDLAGRLVDAARTFSTVRVLSCVSLGVDLTTPEASQLLLAAGGNEILKTPYSGDGALTATAGRAKSGAPPAAGGAAPMLPPPASEAAAAQASSSSSSVTDAASTLLSLHALPLLTTGHVALLRAVSRSHVDVTRVLVHAGTAVTSAHIVAAVSASFMHERECGTLLSLAGPATPALVGDVRVLQDAFNGMTGASGERHGEYERSCAVLARAQHHPLVDWLCSGDSGVLVVIAGRRSRRGSILPPVRVSLLLIPGIVSAAAIAAKLAPCRAVLQQLLHHKFTCTFIHAKPLAVLVADAECAEPWVVERMVSNVSYWTGHFTSSAVAADAGGAAGGAGGSSFGAGAAAMCAAGAASAAAATGGASGGIPRMGLLGGPLVAGGLDHARLMRGRLRSRADARSLVLRADAGAGFGPNSSRSPARADARSLALRADNGAGFDPSSSRSRRELMALMKAADDGVDLVDLTRIDEDGVGWSRARRNVRTLLKAGDDGAGPCGSGASGSSGAGGSSRAGPSVQDLTAQLNGEADALEQLVMLEHEHFMDHMLSEGMEEDTGSPQPYYRRHKAYQPGAYQPGYFDRQPAPPGP